MADEETQVEPAAPVNDEAQAEQAAPAEEGANAPETAEDKAEKVYAGKFKSVEDLEKSYEELQSSFTRERQTMAQEREQVPGQAIQPPADETLDLDPTVVPALDRWYAERREREKANEFARRHAEELKDPILAGTVQRLIQEGSVNQKYVDQEEALATAKKLLEERVKPQVKEAAAQGIEQGQEIARKKGELGAVGESGPRPKVNLDELKAEEFAKYHGLEYSE